MPAPANWLEHLQDEADAAFLYRELAGAEPDPARREIYQQLAQVEDRHVAAWRALLAEQGHIPPDAVPSPGARLRAWIARRFGDPTISIYPCRPTSNGAGIGVELFGTRFPLPPTCAEAADRECLLGLRPEHFQVALERMEGAVPAELDAVTPLNVRAVLLLKTRDGREILATCWEDEAARFPRGHRAAWATLRPDDLMLFDASGARLAPGAH